jgi:hypothetical protein
VGYKSRYQAWYTRRVSKNNLHQVKLKIGKPNNSNVFESNSTKGPKQDIQSLLRSPMTEGVEPWF